ncbi:MAG: Membrane Protein Functionally coupled to the MukBEF Chromosome Partitioning Mechanism [uncultured Sulfurovum sp.]|uniref:Membrane Protein Functionally coupled to the MukBEF Chromosome Partitioning Mechanism n=1 Tax=uncultured Sulfurovum sp. TaxID=269237 RepID=A0A6S6S9N6_9BACT|nr:MAG: Membrane Protein Functionally coupled to the MukBEF Chromosome Partitioning Mechanism [uncultured Sulfurovum sp.]
MNVELSFMLKKMLSVALMPWSIAILLSLLALFFLYRHKIQKAKKYLTISILWVILISWAPFANLALKPLESSYERLENIPENIEYILLLGGDRNNRAWEALRLYHKIPNVKIITSGHSLHDPISDAEKTATKLIESGIPEERVLMQAMAKTTFEEAQHMKERVGEKPFILITAAYHMPRAMKLFKKAGLNPIAAPADFNRPEETGYATVLQSKQLKNTERAWHEYLGILFYKLQGKI